MSEAAAAKKPRSARGNYQKERREAAERSGRCSRCTSKTRMAEPGLKTCGVCLAKQAKNDLVRTDRPRATKVGKSKSFIHEQGDGADAEVRLKRTPVASGKCGRRGCQAKPDGEGFVYCRPHGSEYAERLRKNPDRGGSLEEE